MMNNATLAIRWVGRRLGFGKPETISAPTATKRLVGSPACDAIYRIAHNWAYERFVNRMAVMTGDDDITCLELCGTWRITRIRLHPGYHWSFHQWHPVKQEWFSIDCQKLPEIRLIGRGAQRANLAKALISHACRWYCEVAAQTCRPALLALTQLRKPKTIEETISWAEQILSEDRMRHKQRYEPLDAAGGMAAAALWKLLDPDHVRAACQIFMGGGPTFAQYIAIQSEFEAIKKVRAEHPNFLPLLRVIPSRLWADHNLFAQWERRYDEHGPSEADKHLRWESLVGATEIDGVEILPLDTARKLAEEGEALHHCVGTYARICYSSAQRIFSLRAGELRSTLRLVRDDDTWRIAEHRSFCNDLAPEPFRKVAEKVAMAYTVAERAGAATATKASELLTNGEL